MGEDLISKRLHLFKKNIHHWMGNLTQSLDKFQTRLKKIRIEKSKPSEETFGVKYSYTENAEIAKDAPKTEAIGIDSFGEENTFDPDVADEHQDYRNRNQNSDLANRFYTDGMDIKKADLEH
jgi:hypothetical protein